MSMARFFRTFIIPIKDVLLVNISVIEHYLRPCIYHHIMDSLCNMFLTGHLFIFKPCCPDVLNLMIKL